MQVKDIYEIVGFAEALCSIISFVAGLGLGKSVASNKKRLLKKLLSTGGCPRVYVSVPKFKSHILDKERDSALWDELDLLLDINTLLAKANIETTTMVDELSIESDEIQIGGPVSNVFTNRYINRFFKEFQWIVTEEHLERYMADDNLKKLNYSFINADAEAKEGFKVGDSFYEYVPGKKGWAIIAKIIDDTGIEPRTIHLLFGCGTNGTIGAVKYFKSSFPKIYRKNKQNPYIGIIEVDGQGGLVGNISWLDTKDILVSSSKE